MKPNELNSIAAMHLRDAIAAAIVRIEERLKLPKLEKTRHNEYFEAQDEEYRVALDQLRLLQVKANRDAWNALSRERT